MNAPADLTVEALGLIAEHTLDAIAAERLIARLEESLVDRADDGERSPRAGAALSMLRHAARHTINDLPPSLLDLPPAEREIVAQAALEVLSVTELRALHAALAKRLDRRYPRAERAEALAACRLISRAAKEAESQCR